MTSLVTAAQIAEVRRMTGETAATYSNTLLTAIIEKYPLLDEQGEEPWTLSSDTPPVHEDNDDWMPTYDLNAAAADVWAEKAAALAGLYDFSADGGNYRRSQAYEQCMKQSRHYRARASAYVVTLHQSPEEPSISQQVWVGNLPEPD